MSNWLSKDVTAFTENVRLSTLFHSQTKLKLT